MAKISLRLVRSALRQHEQAGDRRPLARPEAALALGHCLDAADDHVGRMRPAENRIELQRSGQASHHPADRRVAEILVSGKGVDLEEAGGRRFEAHVVLRLEIIVLVEAAQVDHGVDRAGIEREQDEGLRLLPRAVGAGQHHPGLAVGADIFLVQLLLEIARRRRRFLVAAQMRGNRASGQHDDVVVGGLDDGEVRTEQADIVDPGKTARRVGMVDEGHVGMRIERVDVAAGRALGGVAHIGILRALEELGRRRVAAILDIQPDDRHRLDGGEREHDPDQDRDRAEEALLHRLSISSDIPCPDRACRLPIECFMRTRASRHPMTTS